MVNLGNFLVCTECTTYNHGEFITDALHGFVIQQTTFPTLYLIVDDASTDDTQKKIEDFISDGFEHDSGQLKEWADEYANYRFTKRIDNPNCAFLILFLKRNLFQEIITKSKLLEEWESGIKYLARCEGDDYWTDPMKLQKQVDFLESHPDYAICCHRYSIYNQNSATWQSDYVTELFNDHPDGFTFTKKDNLYSWITKTMTVCFRKNALDDSFTKYKLKRDVHDNYHILKKGLGFCLPDNMAVYRKHGGGIWAGLGNLEQRKTSILVYQDLYTWNTDDQELKDAYQTIKRSFFSDYVYTPLLHRIVDKSFAENAGFILKVYRMDDGLIEWFLYICRAFKAIFLGYFTTQNSSAKD